MKLENKLALLSETEFNQLSPNVLKLIANINVNEANVDALVLSILLNDLGYDNHEVELAVTKLRNSDIKIPSKSVNTSGNGKLDCAIFINDQLRVVIEDKEPSEPIEKAIDEAQFYAEGLNKKGEDIRIIIGFNGTKMKLKVLDHTSLKWVPFFINGEELEKFPSKKIVEIIYNYKDVHGIKVEDIQEEINIQDIVWNLKTIYRNTDLQNDNQKTIDFTVAFIGLKSVLEKYRGLGERGFKLWEELNPKENPKDNSSADDEDLRDALTQSVNKIIEKKKDEFKDLFIIKDSEQIETFNFEKTLKTFTSDYELKCLRNIYIEISRLHDLHHSQIDLFGEVYESLGDKNTKKAFGQFFTRRHIIKTLIELFEIDINSFIGELKPTVNPKDESKVILKAIAPQKVCDPACGTGGFITELYKHLVSEARVINKFKDIDFSDLSSSSFHGYDIYTSNVTRTKINMYLAGDGFSDVRKADTLQDSEIKSNSFDYIITNPPYGKGTVTVNYPQYVDGELKALPVIGNQRLEVNFLVKIVDMLKPTGKAMVIIPDGVLEATTLSDLREWFLLNCELTKIVSLPKHAFAPYTHEKTYAIYFTKRSKPLNNLTQVEQDGDIWAYIVDNDGYANSDKRFRTDCMDENGKYLHDEFSSWRGIDGSLNDSLLIERFKRKTQQENECFYSEWDEIIEGDKYGYIKASQILEDEFISYKSITANELVRKINSRILDEINYEIIFNSSVQKQKLTEYKENILEQLALKQNIHYDSELKIFLNKNKVLVKKLTNKELCSLVNEECKDTEQIIKHPHELLTLSSNGTSINKAYIHVLSKIGILYDLSSKTPKFWLEKNQSYQKIERDKAVTLITKIIAQLYLAKSINDIITPDTGEVNIDYLPYFQDLNLEYDSYEKKTYDLNVKNIKKTLVLSPEKYFRKVKAKSISIEEMQTKNSELIDSLSSLLKQFSS
ncbi:N-6 DNA methylase [Pseudoalteromonas sp. NFXS39]|uniref:N-6 DNA methylase n=1 Tax=Pseudoalteromonas sp. NFXS39 TaxID=2818437 RepID=UPI0032E051D4